MNEIRTAENTVGEQVAVDKTTVKRRGSLNVSAYGYDPAERVSVRLRGAEGDHGHGKREIEIGQARADELGRLSYHLHLPPHVKHGTYVVYLESQNQKITSPVITVTK